MPKLVEWFRTEPVRTVLYPILLVVTGYLFAKGLIDGETRLAIESILAFLVGAGGVEAARSQVSPTKRDYDHAA